MRSDVYSQLISLRGDRSLTGYSPSRFSALTNSNLAAEGKMEEWEVALVSLTIPSAIKSYWDVAPENRKIVIQRHRGNRPLKTEIIPLGRDHFTSTADFIQWISTLLRENQSMLTFRFVSNAEGPLWFRGGKTKFQARVKEELSLIHI